MARIPEEEIARIKREVSLIRLVESSGIALKKHGQDWFGLCPFHEDKTPSLSITPEKNIWNCLGACQQGGDVFRWVEKMHGVSFTQAYYMLKEQAPSLAATCTPVKQSTTPKLSSPLSDNADEQTALQQVIAYYHNALKQNVDAQNYLKQRGLDDVELIDHFKLGVANRTLTYRLPEKNRKAGAAIRGQLQRIGILRDSGHEHFNGSLIIPIINDHKILEVYGRKLQGNKLRKGTATHLYLPGAHQGVFNRDGLLGDEIILCESLIDALTFWRWGFKQVTCSYGVNGFTDELLQCFIDKKIKRVLIAYDRDEAGNQGAEKLATQLNKNNIDAYRILFPKNMDANEYAQHVTPPQKSLGLVIRQAEPLGNISNSPNQPLAADIAEAELDIQSTPVPKDNQPNIPTEIKPNNEVHITLSDRHYRIKGFDPKANDDALKINLMVKKGDAFHLDKLDLSSAKQRQIYINQASVECGVSPQVIKTDLGKLVLQLELLQQTQSEDTQAPELKTLTTEEREAALSLLTDPDLLNRILQDFNAAGVVGEETNKLVGYLACVSRLLQKPLAVMVQSSSAAGKSSLMDAILNLMPKDERVQYSAMTGQSLFYMGENDLKHKILAITEEEGAHNASYALKLLQSEGEVTIASTGKDDTTGDLVTRKYRVEGPVMLFMTTTAIDIDEELMNRCLILSVDESREQTKAIHERQRAEETLDGLFAREEKNALTTLHQNAQQLLKPVVVINPYARHLTFLDDQTRTRRDHKKYLTLIKSITLLHQYQRELKTQTRHGQAKEYIEVSLRDIELANQLAHEILGHTLDELPPQTRKLLTQIKTFVTEACKKQTIKQSDYRFSRKALRGYTNASDTQLRLHLS